VFVPEIEPDRRPEKILFIGELYRQKGVDVLIEQYERAFIKDPDVPSLMIVGDGAERDILEDIVSKKGLNEKIDFLGKITDDSVLKGIFDSAIITISPKQAGLSVLKSMAYGVPFVTLENAITGGEIFNIENGETGLLLKSEDEISDVILNCRENADRYCEMGIKARDFYFKNRTMKQMVNAFDEAIRFVISD
jgi:glycosyltransferase involved in cell wall biosynthesis